MPKGPAFDRRSFLRLLGVTGAGVAGIGLTGTALTGCAPSGSSGPQEGPLADAGASLDDASNGSGKIPSSEDLVDQRARDLLTGMSDHEKLCQLFVVAPETLTGMGTVVQAGDTTKERLDSYPVGGIIYFAKNLIDEAQTTTMLQNTFDFGMEADGIPPFLCVDEEGGTVVRIGGKDGFSANNVGDMADIGATGDPFQAKEAAEYVGSYLKELGFNTDFAPVCDVANNPESDTMRQRSFGSDAELVASMVAAQVEGFTEVDMLCSAKHFPGIGAAVGDSHNEAIAFHGTLEDLRAIELVPFQAAIEAGVPMVMVSHLSLPSIVGDDTPACLSRTIVTDILREDLGFDRNVITDSLSMDAITDYYSTGEACLLALEAGCDLLLAEEDFPEAFAAVEKAVAEGRISWDRIDESVMRILRIKVKHFFD